MDYAVVHSGRRTIAIQIQRDGRVVVRAPYAATAEDIRRVVDSHRDWVEKTVRRQQEQRRHEKNLKLGKRKPWVAPTKDRKALSGAEARLAAQKPGEKHPSRPKVPKKGPVDRDKA